MGTSNTWIPQRELEEAQHGCKVEWCHRLTMANIELRRERDLASKQLRAPCPKHTAVECTGRRMGESHSSRWGQQPVDRGSSMLMRPGPPPRGSLSIGSGLNSRSCCAEPAVVR